MQQYKFHYEQIKTNNIIINYKDDTIIINKKITMKHLCILLCVFDVVIGDT